MGYEWAACLYGREAMACSPELTEWVKSDESRSIRLGVPIGMFGCRCDRAGRRTHALRCPKLKLLLHEVGGASQWDKFRWGAINLLCSVSPLREVLSEIRRVFEHALENDCSGDVEAPCQREPRMALTEQACLWPDAHWLDMITLDLIRTARADPRTKTCADPYLQLAKSVHLAILREQECWLCDGPANTRFNKSGQLHAVNEAALVYADGTALCVSGGSLLPSRYILTPEVLTLEALETVCDPHYHRGVLLNLFGMPRYLRNRSAEIIDSNNTGAIWRLCAGQRGIILFLEDYRFPAEVFESTYFELPLTATTMAEAFALADGEEALDSFISHRTALPD